MTTSSRSLDIVERLKRAGRRLLGWPDLHWLVLPAYEIPGMAVVDGVVVQNMGRGIARNVKIELSFPHESNRLMHQVQVFSQDDYILRGGGEGQRFVTLRLRELRPDNSVVVYFASHEPMTPEVTVSHFQKTPFRRVK